MAELRNGGPYIWATWLTKLLVGENSCEWASWFKAQHEASSWERVPSGFDQAGWMLAHTEAVRVCRERWDEQGYTVFTEGQNAFTLVGKTATLGGKPDLIVRNGSAGTIIDVKTGTPSPAHVAQVMLYQYAVPKALGQYRGIRFDEKLVYRGYEIDIPVDAIDEAFVGNMVSLIGRLAASTPARRVPSAQECGFCEITGADCPERLPDQREEGQTEDF